MAELGAALGLTWAGVIEREQAAWTPADGAFTTPLRFTYSCEGPQHVELLQGVPGSLWDGTDQPGAHHHGVWVDDVAAETERLIAAGWTLEMAQSGTAGRVRIDDLRPLAERVPAGAGHRGRPTPLRTLVGRRGVRMTAASPRLAVVTGGGTGIGRAIAEALIRAGDDVVLVGRREDVLVATVPTRVRHRS